MRDRGARRATSLFLLSPVGSWVEAARLRGRVARSDRGAVGHGVNARGGEASNRGPARRRVAEMGCGCIRNCCLHHAWNGSKEDARRMGMPDPEILIMTKCGETDFRGWEDSRLEDLVARLLGGQLTSMKRCAQSGAACRCLDSSAPEIKAVPSEPSNLGTRANWLQRRVNECGEAGDSQRACGGVSEDIPLRHDGCGIVELRREMTHRI
ncbi:hypothetical protein DFH09DRAFT_1070594 [Mycena vulgaris]|nr:hypothetical protein DFH09DRAFT_1070594 [Mycena vulgaris]